MVDLKQFTIASCANTQPKVHVMHEYRILQIVRGGKVLRFSQIDRYRETFPVK